jgi:hypothetical protein
VRTVTAIVIIALSVPLLLGSDCNGKGGGVLQEKATVHMRVKKDLGEESNLEYAFTVEWDGQGPSSGNGVATIDETKEYEGFTDLNGDAKATQIFLDLRPGAWTFSAAADGWSATCERTLTAGQQHYVNFTYGGSGCTDTASF